MTIHQLRILNMLLYAAEAGLIVIACWQVVRLAHTQPGTRLQLASPIPSIVERQTSAGIDEGLNELNWYDVLTHRNLQQELVQAEPRATPTPVPRPSTPLPQLVSTFVEGDDRWACLRNQRGRTVVVSEKEVVDGYTVVRIGMGWLEFEDRGQRRRIRIEHPPQIVKSGR